MKTRSGSSLLVILCVVATLSTCVAVALSFTSAVSRNVQRSNQYRQATEIGDGVVEQVFAHWREKCRAQPHLQFATQDFDTLPLPPDIRSPDNLFPDVPNFRVKREADPTFTVSNIKVEALDENWKPLPASTLPTAVHGMNLATTSYYYLASADVTLPTISNLPITVKTRRILQKEITSPWNYAIFYQDPLEIHPGAAFEVTGWVHTNSKLWTGSSQLKFLSKVTYGDDWAVAFMPESLGYFKSKVPTAPTHPANLPPAIEQGHQPFGLDSTRIFSTADTNPNNDSYRELVERPSKATGNPVVDADPIAEARYYNQASARILVKDVSGSPVLEIFNKAGVKVTAASTGTDKAIYDTFFGAVKLNDKIQDNREGKEIRLVTIDMSKVDTALRSGGALFGKGFNNVIYVSDTSATATNRRGVRLKNGAIMPPGGITVATDNPCYVQGDYNTGTTTTAKPNSNVVGGDPKKNIVTGYKKESCAVAADAIMVLSNTWTDAASYSDVSLRLATPTTVNAAFLSGIVPSGPAANGDYSGGVENFPRFLEKWTGNTFTYHGSMVQLFHSKQHVGSFSKGGNSVLNVYDPPVRKWFFDTQFYMDPPPGTLTIMNYNKARWYLE